MFQRRPSGHHERPVQRGQREQRPGPEVDRVRLRRHDGRPLEPVGLEPRREAGQVPFPDCSFLHDKRSASECY